MRAWALAILAAVVFHAAILLFGGIFFLESEDQAATEVQDVDLVTARVEEEQEKPAETPAEPPPEVEVTERETPPEMPEVVQAAPQVEATDLVARLDAMSLGALESALDPGAGDSGFGGGVSLASGGRIGGTGLPGASGGLSDSMVDAVFDIAALDQAPRVVHQVAPVYPQDLRRRQVEGTVYVVFVVDQEGRVHDPSVETSPDAAFEGAALEAVRRWKFEPAVIRGEKVRSKIRVPIRFALDS